MRKLQMPTMSLPSYPVRTTGSPPDQGLIFLWQQDVQDMKKKILLLKENKKRFCALSWDSALPSSKAKSKAQVDTKLLTRTRT
jgi:hypothetical protein